MIFVRLGESGCCFLELKPEVSFHMRVPHSVLHSCTSDLQVYVNVYETCLFFFVRATV